MDYNPDIYVTFTSDDDGFLPTSWSVIEYEYLRFPKQQTSHCYRLRTEGSYLSPSLFRKQAIEFIESTNNSIRFILWARTMPDLLDSLYDPVRAHNVAKSTSPYQPTSHTISSCTLRRARSVGKATPALLLIRKLIQPYSYIQNHKSQPLHSNKNFAGAVSE